MTKALTMSGFLVRKPQRASSKDKPLMGGVGKRPLTEQEIQWAKERKEQAKAQRAINDTIAKLRREREANKPITATLRGVAATAKQGTGGK